MKKVFPGARGEWSLALLAVGSTALAACGSNSATYRPAPRYTSSPPTTTAPAPYQPTGPTTTTPPPPPPPRGGQMACGKGKCG